MGPIVIIKWGQPVLLMARSGMWWTTIKQQFPGKGGAYSKDEGEQKTTQPEAGSRKEEGIHCSPSQISPESGNC